MRHWVSCRMVWLNRYIFTFSYANVLSYCVNNKWNMFRDSWCQSWEHVYRKKIDSFSTLLAEYHQQTPLLRACFSVGGLSLLETSFNSNKRDFLQPFQRVSIDIFGYLISLLPNWKILFVYSFSNKLWWSQGLNAFLQKVIKFLNQFDVVEVTRNQTHLLNGNKTKYVSFKTKILNLRRVPWIHKVIEFLNPLERDNRQSLNLY